MHLSKFNQIENLVQRFTSVNRYSTSFLIKKESLAEHSSIVALVAISLWSDIVENPANYNMSPSDYFFFVEEVKIADLMKCAILHDLDEAYTGDIVRPTKYFNESVRKEFESVEDATRRMIVSKFGSEFESIDYKNALPKISAQFLKLVDLITVIMKLREEIDLGNSIIARNMIDDLLRLRSTIKFDNFVLTTIWSKIDIMILDIYERYGHE